MHLGWDCRERGEMKMLKRMLGGLMVLCILAMGMQLCVVAQEAGEVVRVGSLKGPTTMGLSKMMRDEEDKEAYAFTMAGVPDEIAPLLAKGEIDIALIPCNLAAVLHQKMEGGLQVAAINTLGVLYVVEEGESVQTVEDLRGQRMLSTGKGTTPEYALNYVLRRNGIEPGTDIEIDYRSEATEVLAAIGNGVAKLAVLPQPFVTAAMAQNPNLRVALSLTEEWEKVSADGALVTGVVAVRRAFAQAHPERLAAFLEAYEASTAYVNAHPAEIAPYIETLGIAKAQIAEKAIPACNIVSITGEEMAEKVAGYLAVLYEENPQSVGGTLPNEAFYITEIEG